MTFAPILDSLPFRVTAVHDRLIRQARSDVTELRCIRKEHYLRRRKCRSSEPRGMRKRFIDFPMWLTGFLKLARPERRRRTGVVRFALIFYPKEWFGINPSRPSSEVIHAWGAAAFLRRSDSSSHCGSSSCTTQTVNSVTLCLFFFV